MRHHPRACEGLCLGGGARAGQIRLTQRGIESEGVTADKMQFEEERDFPYKQVQYLQSLLQGLPIGSESYSYAEPSALSEILSGAGGIGTLYDKIFGGGGVDSSLPSATVTAGAQ